MRVTAQAKLDFLDSLKAHAERAELDKDNFWLHINSARRLRLGVYGREWTCTHIAAVARAQRHGIHDEVSEALAQ